MEKLSGRPDEKGKDRMAWLLLLLAGLFEVVWAYSMKLSEGFTRLGPSVITIFYDTECSAALYFDADFTSRYSLYCLDRNRRNRFFYWGFLF